MPLTIQLSEKSERRLAERAAEAGKTPAEFVTEVVEREVLRERTLAEIMAPVRAEFAASGMTEVELDAIILQARDEARAERRGTGA